MKSGNFFQCASYLPIYNNLCSFLMFEAIVINSEVGNGLIKTEKL